MRRFRILALLLLAAPAGAHEWYDAYCCDNRDCAPIPYTAVSVEEHGYRITLMPGDHPMVFEPFQQFIPFDSPNIRPSQDAGYHACLIAVHEIPEVQSGDPVGLRCLYLGGVS